MSADERNYRKIKTLKDFETLDAPAKVNAISPPECPHESQMILRMLVRPKYSDRFYIPEELQWLAKTIWEFADFDAAYTGVIDSWCYVTVRHGPVVTQTDDEWHFDGASFRTGLIPERNYIWVSHTPMQYKEGGVKYPEGFDPTKYNLFSYAEKALEDQPILESEAKTWYLVTPFCFHRRNPVGPKGLRTFIRISFPDIEGRDINNTPNPLLPTDAFGRDPVKNFRNNLLDWA